MIIIKIGGGKDINAQGIISDVAQMDEQIIIVHGANHYRDQLLDDLGQQKKILRSLSGYSSVYSDDDMIDAIMMTYAGLRNKRIVEMCQQHGINAVGLSGIDGKLIQGRRNRGVRVKEGDKVKIVRDNSGKPQAVNRQLLQLLLDLGYTPVISIPIIDENGNAINTENDSVVRLLQQEMQAKTIIQFIEAPGFLEMKDDPNSVVAEISHGELERRESQVQGRMKRKLLSLKKLFDGGSCTVIMADGRTEHPVTDALAGNGTVIR